MEVISNISNLIQGISFKLSAQKPPLAIIEDKEKLEEIQKQFIDYYENHSKTGFYIHTHPEDASSEEVQFFNYNEEGGWWMEIKENQYVFFNSQAVLLNLKPEELNQEKYTLKQFSKNSNPQPQAEMNINTYDYALMVLYDTKEALDQFKTTLDNKKYNNLAISAVQTHEKSEKDFRVTIFIGKYPEFGGEQKIELDMLLSEIKTKLTPKIFVNCVVKEEIKYFFDDFEDDTKFKITEYTQQHRYECLYNSESDHTDKSDEDDDNDEGHANHSKLDGEEDEDQSQEGSDEDDQDDNQPKLIFAEKTV